MSNFSFLDFIHNFIYKICKIISVRVRNLITVYSFQVEEIAELKKTLREINKMLRKSMDQKITAYDHFSLVEKAIKKCEEVE